MDILQTVFKKCGIVAHTDKDSFGVTTLHGDVPVARFAQSYSELGIAVKKMVERLQQHDEASYWRVKFLAEDLVNASKALIVVKKHDTDFKELNLDLVDNHNWRVSTLVVGVLCHMVQASSVCSDGPEFETLKRNRAKVLGFISNPLLVPVFSFLIKGTAIKVSIAKPGDDPCHTDEEDLRILTLAGVVAQYAMLVADKAAGGMLALINAKIPALNKEVKAQMVDKARDFYVESGCSPELAGMCTVMIETALNNVPEAFDAKSFDHMMAGIAFQVAFFREAVTAHSKAWMVNQGSISAADIDMVLKVNDVLMDMFLKRFSKEGFAPAAERPLNEAPQADSVVGASLVPAVIAETRVMEAVVTQEVASEVVTQKTETTTTAITVEASVPAGTTVIGARPAQLPGSENSPIRQNIRLITDWVHAKAEETVLLFMADSLMNQGEEATIEREEVKKVLGAFNKAKKIGLLREYMAHRAHALRTNDDGSEYIMAKFGVSDPISLEAQVNAICSQMANIVRGIKMH